MYFNENITNRLGFSLVAEAYDHARPSYPKQIFSDLMRAAGPPKEANQARFPKVLEIGPGTGQLTSSLIELSGQLNALEPGPQFAQILRERYREQSQIQIVPKTLENYQSPHCYDLLASACALHWVPKELAYQKIHQLLKPGGWLLALWNQPRFTPEIYSIIDAVFPETIPGFRIPRCSQDEVELFHQGVEELQSKRGFVDCQAHIHREPRTVSPQTLVRLIWSYVSDERLTAETRRELLSGLTQAVDRLNQDQFQLENYFPAVFGRYQPKQ